MEYVNLGRSGLKTSRIGLGCMGFGDVPGGWNPWALTEEEAAPIFRQAVDLGVTLWDTANAYGGTAGCAVLLAASATLPADTRLPAWGVIAAAYLAGLAAVILATGPRVAAALSITDAVIERFGLLTIIVLGETVTGVVNALAGQPTSVLTFSVGMVAVMIGFGAWWTYFDLVGHRPPRRDQPATLRWLFGHLPLTAAIAVMGAAMVNLVHDAHADHTPPSTAWALAGGAAAVLAATMLISTSLRAWHDEHGVYRPLTYTCAGVPAASVGVGDAAPTPLVLGLGLVVLLSVPWVVAFSRRLALTDTPLTE